MLLLRGPVPHCCLCIPFPAYAPCFRSSKHTITGAFHHMT